MLRSAATLWRVATRESSVSQSAINQARNGLFLSRTVTLPYVDLAAYHRCQTAPALHAVVNIPLRCEGKRPLNKVVSDKQALYEYLM